MSEPELPSARADEPAFPSGLRPVRPVIASKVLVLVATLSVWGCDSFLFDPAPASSATVEVLLDPARAGVGGGLLPSSATWGVREVGFRFSVGSEIRDTAVVGEYVDGSLRASVTLHPAEMAAGLVVRAEVRARGGLPLFTGTDTLDETGPTRALHVELDAEPVLAFLVGAANLGSQVIGLSRYDGSLRTTHPSERALSIDVSPLDGTLAFHSSKGVRIYLMNPYTGQVRRLTNPQAPDRFEFWPQFSSDGQWVYFEGDSDGSVPAGIWRARPDGSDLELVVSAATTGGPAYRPGISPDGGAIALPGSPIRVVDVTSGSTTPLGVSGTATRWSPDGQLIAYRDGSDRLRLIEAGGANDRPLTSAATVGDFEWVDGGARVLAVSDGGLAFRIDVVTLDTEVIAALGDVVSVSVLPR